MKEVPEVSAELEATIRTASRDVPCSECGESFTGYGPDWCSQHMTGRTNTTQRAIDMSDTSWMNLVDQALQKKRAGTASELDVVVLALHTELTQQATRVDRLERAPQPLLEQAAVTELEASEARSFDDCVLSAIVGGRTRAADIGVCVAAFLSRGTEPREIDRALQRLRRAGRIRFTSAHGWRPVPAGKDSEGGGA